MSRVAVVHPTSLLGKEMRETLETRPDLSLPHSLDLVLLSADEEEIGTLTEIRGAPVVVGHGTPGALEGVDLAFFCGSLEESRELLETLPAETTAILLAPEAGAADGIPVIAGINLEAAVRSEVLLSPHPAVIFLAHLLHPLRSLDLLRAAATVVQPTSLFSDPGLDALLEQTRHVLMMRGRATGGLFGGQLVFNLLPSQTSPELISSQLTAVFGEDPAVAVDLLQGAVFHGMSTSVWVELGRSTAPEEVLEALAESPWIEPAEEPTSLGPIDAAAEGKVILGEVRRDPSRAGGFWIRAVMDNLTRGGALNAAEIAEAVLQPVVT